MAVSVVSTAETAVSTAGTSHTITLPASIAAGDLVLITMDIGSTSATLNALANWTEILDESSANGLKILWYTGAGVPGNPTFTSSASTRSASIAWRITGADKTVTPTIGTTSTGTSLSPQPPASAAPPRNNDYLFITFVGMAGEEADDDTWGNTPPTNYLPSPPLQKSCGTASVNLGGLIVAASRVLNTNAAQTPGTFSVDVSAAYRAQTITVHPANFKDNPVGTVSLVGGRAESGGSKYELAVQNLSPGMFVRLQEPDPGLPANVLNDQFTGADTTLLESHTADSGDTWTKHADSISTAQIITNRIRATGANEAMYYSSDVPASPDYVVATKLRCVTNITATAGVHARLTTSSPYSSYRLYYFGTFNLWWLYKIVAGSATSLGTWSEALGAGDERIAELHVDGDQIAAVIDGTVRIEVADSDITAAGRAGVVVNTATDSTGLHLDYVTARPLKSATIFDSSGNAHDGTAIGEFTLGGSSFTPADGSMVTVSEPQKGGRARFAGYTPFASGASRTFVGTTSTDPASPSTNISCFFGGEGLSSDVDANLPVAEAVYNGTDGYHSNFYYNSEVAVMGAFGSAAWYSVLPGGRWFHWALTVIDNTPAGFQTLELFVNGVSQGTADILGTDQPNWHANSGPYLLGSRGQGSALAATGHALEGKHGSQAVFDRILSAVEIQNLARTAGLLEVEGTVVLSGTRTESYSPPGGPTYNDTRTGTVVVSGTRTESKVATDTRTGTVVLSGTRTESSSRTEARSGVVVVRGTRTESNSRTEARAGTLVLSGTRTESQAKVYTDSRSGVLLITGSRVESRSVADTRSGTVVVTGSATRSGAYVETRSGVLLIAGTRTESYQAAGAVVYNDTATGTVTLAGTRVESRAASETPIGRLVLAGTRVEGNVRTEARSGQLVLRGTVVESHALAFTDQRSGTVVLSGSRVESRSGTETRSGAVILSGSVSRSSSRVSSPIGVVVLGGTRTESWSKAGISNDTPSGSVVVVGTRVESHSVAGTRSGSVVLAGSVVESRVANETRSGTVVLTGTRTESNSRTEARSGTVLLAGSRTESNVVLGEYNDAPTGRVIASGTRTESHAEVSKPTGTVVLQGVRTEVKAHSQSVSGKVVTAGTRTESWGKAYTDAPVGRVILSGSRVESRARAYVDTPFGSIYLSGSVTHSATYVQALVGALTVQGAVSELYLPSGATFHVVRGEVRIAGLIREEHNRWDNTGDDRWPPDTDNQWPTSSSGRWGDNVETDRWEVDATV